MNNEHASLTELNGPLLEATSAVLAEPIFKETEARMLEAARRLDDAKPSPGPKKSTWTRRVLLLAAVASGFLVIAAWPERRDAWAEVVKAMQQQKWLLTTTNGEQSDRTWYSQELEIVAGASKSESHEGFVLMDLKNRTIDWYSVRGVVGLASKPGMIFRTAIRDDNRHGIDNAVGRFEAVLAGRNPTEILTGDVEVVSHKERVLDTEGRRLVEHTFSLNLKLDANRVRRVVVIIDQETGLPIEKRVRTEGEPEFVQKISFPDSGPTSIYQLGAPKDAEIVDDRPSETAQSLLDALTAGRTEMDPYVAIATEGKDRDPRVHSWLRRKVRKQKTKWRVELIQKHKSKDDISLETDPTEWWFQFATDAKTLVKTISDGKTECSYSPVRIAGNPVDPENTDFLLVKTYNERQRRHRDTRDPDHYDQTQLPEWYAYPKLVYDAKFVVDESPDDGPENTIRIEAKHGSTHRLWLDPKRGYICLRSEVGKPNDGDRSFGETEILEFQQSPTGKWLPQLIRQTVTQNRKQQVTYVNFFYDFEADLEEELFEIKDL